MRKFLRFLFQRFGYDIVKYHPPFIRGKTDKTSVENEYKWLMEFKFTSIIDIGANEGQFADKIRLLFPDAYIYAFEPLPSAFERLKDNFKEDKKFAAFNLGLGEERSVLQLHENEYSPSSSFLNLTDVHTKNFEEAVKTKELSVNVERLDEVFESMQIELPLLVKIDVQGFEDNVIRGGTNTLQKASAIICELSFVELYKGQALFEDILHLFMHMGFKYAGSIEQLRSPETNRILQADGIFIKK